MKTKSVPNQQQKQWMSDIAEFIQEHTLAVLYPGYECRTDFQLHHVTGRAYRHNKVYIGHWFIIPVPVELHDPSSNHPDNVTRFKYRFTDQFGMQRDLFDTMLKLMYEDGYRTPNDDVHQAIMSTRS